MTDIVMVLALKIYSVVVLIGCGVLWYITARNAWHASKEIGFWALLLFIFGGLAVSLYFIDIWRP